MENLALDMHRSKNDSVLNVHLKPAPLPAFSSKTLEQQLDELIVEDKKPEFEIIIEEKLEPEMPVKKKSSHPRLRFKNKAAEESVLERLIEMNKNVRR